MPLPTLSTRPNALSISVRAVLAATVLASTLVGCGESSSSTAGPDFGSPTVVPNDFNQTELLSNIADNIVAPTYTQFATLSGQLITDINSYCTTEAAFDAQTATADDVDLALSGAQASWRAAMNQWQQIELMQFAPLLNNDGILRDRIYSWPVVSSCGVDLDVVSFEAGNINGSPYNIAQRTPARKGLDALEYLLFNSNLDHSCTGNTFPEGWNGRTEQSRKIARCAFAEEVATDINNNADVLVNEWVGNNGYANVLKTAGTVGSQFETEQAAVNHISDAMFYIDSITKDGKLATPLGLFANVCGAEACPEAVESPYANNSLNNVLNNLLSLQKLYSGDMTANDTGIGFDDFLIDVGDSDTAQAMATAIDEAIASINAYQTSLATALENNPEQVESSHDEIRDVTDIMKTDYINSLALELPATSAGDND